MGGKLFNAPRLTNEVYENLKKELSTIFKHYTHDYPKCFTDKDSHGDVDVFILTDNTTQVKELIQSLAYNGQYKGTPFVSSILYEFEGTAYQVDFTLFTEESKYKFNLRTYGYSDFNLLFGLMVKSYGLSMTNNGLVKEVRGKQGSFKLHITDDFDEMLEMFGYQPMPEVLTKKQFKDWFVSGKYFASKSFEVYKVKNSNKHDLERTFFWEMYDEVLELDLDANPDVFDVIEDKLHKKYDWSYLIKAENEFELALAKNYISKERSLKVVEKALLEYMRKVVKHIAVCSDIEFNDITLNSIRNEMKIFDETYAVRVLVTFDMKSIVIESPFTYFRDGFEVTKELIEEVRGEA